MKGKKFTNFVIEKVMNGWTVEENWEIPNKERGYGDSHEQKYVCETFAEVIEAMDKIAKTWKLK